MTATAYTQVVWKRKRRGDQRAVEYQIPKLQEAFNVR